MFEGLVEDLDVLCLANWRSGRRGKDQVEIGPLPGEQLEFSGSDALTAEGADDGRGHGDLATTAPRLRLGERVALVALANDCVTYGQAVPVEVNVGPAQRG